jgi:hypothetical protein
MARQACSRCTQESRAGLSVSRTPRLNPRSAELKPRAWSAPVLRWASGSPVSSSVFKPLMMNIQPPATLAAVFPASPRAASLVVSTREA